MHEQSRGRFSARQNRRNAGLVRDFETPKCAHGMRGDDPDAAKRAHGGSWGHFGMSQRVFRKGWGDFGASEATASGSWWIVHSAVRMFPVQLTVDALSLNGPSDLLSRR